MRAFPDGVSLVSVKKTAIVFLIAALLVSCAGTTLGPVETANNYAEFRGLRLAPLMSAGECRASLGRPLLSGFADDALPPRLAVLNWNIKKGEERGWSWDLGRYAKGKTLVLLQEAALSMGLAEKLPATRYAAFSPGYVKGADITGVATISDVRPRAECRLNAVEPWLGTPKSTNVTEYALADSKGSLVVVNIHALNFSFGLLRYREQLNAVAEVLADFEGAVLLSGDFNTWRQGRQDALLELVEKLGLEPVVFATDHRQTVFGHPLDHIFVRGLTIEDAEVFEVSSSDHNPMVVFLAINSKSKPVQDAMP